MNDIARLPKAKELEVRRESNGARAARQAAEHVADLVHQLDDMRDVIAQCNEHRRYLDGQIDQMQARITQLGAERDYYVVQCSSFRQALTNAASVILGSIKQAETHPFQPIQDQREDGTDA